MEQPVGAQFEHLPGIDALKSSQYFTARENLGKRAVGVYSGRQGNRAYLKNAAYGEYIRMPKEIVDEQNADRLIAIGQTLESEVMPRYLDAAAWSYVEASLAMSSASSVDRIELTQRAEKIWLRAMVNDQGLRQRYPDVSRQSDDETHRFALDLAYLPLVRSIIVGNVTQSVWSAVLKDTSLIAGNSAELIGDAINNNEQTKVAVHRGFLHEANAMMALLNINDPRYVPLPSTARGGAGYFHREQTHDISIINQHWGEIRKVIPMEVKARAKREDIHRYRALILRGRMHLSIGRNSPNPQVTTAAFQAMLEGTADDVQLHSIERMSTNLREMLRLYQQGHTTESVAIGSLTKFHDTDKLAQVFTEHTKPVNRTAKQ